MSKWSEATARYNSKTEKRVLKERKIEMALRRVETDVARNVRHFFSSIEGREARKLLQASHRQIVVASDCRDGSKVAFSYHGITIKGGFSDRSHYNFDLDGAKALLSEFLRHGGKPKELLPLIRQKLDEIADAAPK